MKFTQFVRPFVHSFFSWQRKISELDHQFCLIFCMKLNDDKVKKKSDVAQFFNKKSRQVRTPQRVTKNGPKVTFLGFFQKSKPFICTFF